MLIWPLLKFLRSITEVQLCFFSLASAPLWSTSWEIPWTLWIQSWLYIHISFIRHEITKKQAIIGHETSWNKAEILQFNDNFHCGDVQTQNYENCATIEILTWQHCTALSSHTLVSQLHTIRCGYAITCNLVTIHTTPMCYSADKGIIRMRLLYSLLWLKLSAKDITAYIRGHQHAHSSRDVDQWNISQYHS